MIKINFLVTTKFGGTKHLVVTAPECSSGYGPASKFVNVVEM